MISSRLINIAKHNHGELPQLERNHHFPLGGNKKGGNKPRAHTINTKES